MISAKPKRCDAPHPDKRRARDGLLGPPARRWAGIVTSALFALASSRHPIVAGEQPPKHGGTLEFAVTVEPNDYDCHGNTSFSFLHPIAPHYSTLLKFDPENYPDIVGDLAESWRITPDRLTYEFKLRPNVLFHDGTTLTSRDVKVSYNRIIHPPPGIISARQVDYAAVAEIDTPDPRTIVFHLQWPEAAMLANFASPWNCIYSAAKLESDARFPSTHILGSGPFVFAGHKKGEYWRGTRWDKYFQPGKPYLDSYEAKFIPAGELVKAYLNGSIMAEFRGVAPKQRDELVEALGDTVVATESPWLSELLVVFNTARGRFADPRVRRALSMAIDRWTAARQLGGSTFMKYVGGLMRPGSKWATPEADLATFPGFSRDSVTSRTLAKQLLAEAGAQDLNPTLLVRGIPMPHFAGADLIAASWHEIGVNTTQQRLNIWEWQKLVDRRDFDVALDFAGDFYDDPTIQLTKYVSKDLSPINFSGSQDRFLDALYIGQAMATDTRERLKMVRDFERHALTEAYTVPLLWWNRIVLTSAKLKGWHITPSHFVGQDLADVWLDQ